mgnify:CR=1 FL=1
MYGMSHLVHLADDVYAELTCRKKVRNASYSEVIRDMITSCEPPKIYDIKMMLENAKARAAKFKGKREKIDHDLILYGVSRYTK